MNDIQMLSSFSILHDPSLCVSYLWPLASMVTVKLRVMAGSISSNWRKRHRNGMWLEGGQWRAFEIIFRALRQNEIRAIPVLQHVKLVFNLKDFLLPAQSVLRHGLKHVYCISRFNYSSD